MGYPTTVDSGAVSPSIISSDWSQPGNVVTQTFTANQVECFAFELQAPTVVTGGLWHMGATATGKTSMGIYTLNGSSSALVAGSDSGQITNNANADVSFTYATAISLAPGQYLAAISSSNGTDTYMARNAGASNKASRNRVAANAVASNAMPLTTGALSATLNNPSFSLVVQNGLG